MHLWKLYFKQPMVQFKVSVLLIQVVFTLISLLTGKILSPPVINTQPANHDHHDFYTTGMLDSSLRVSKQTCCVQNSRCLYGRLIIRETKFFKASLFPLENMASRSCHKIILRGQLRHFEEQREDNYEYLTIRNCGHSNIGHHLNMTIVYYSYTCTS